MSTNIDDVEVFQPAGVEVVINGEKFNIQPFVLGNRIQVVRLFSSVFIECAKVPGFQNMNDLGAIMNIIEIAGDRLVDIYEIVLGKDKEWLNKSVTIKDEIAIIEAIMKVNDLPFLIRQIQSLTAKQIQKQ